MNYRMIRLSLIIFLMNTTCFASHSFSQFLAQEEGFDDHADHARQSFETVYYQMVERGLFPLTYNNNLIINSKINTNPEQEGTIILKLVEWLEKQNERESLFLLKKLNKLFYLEFHRLIFAVAADREDQAALLEVCQDLYQHKATINGYLEKPFRTALSKLYLLIAIVNGSKLSYENKKKTLAYVLDKTKKEMLLINGRLEGSALDAKTIKKFITLLEIIGIKEPLVQSSRLRNILITTVIIAIVCVIIYYKVIVPRWDEIKTLWLTYGKWTDTGVKDKDGYIPGLKTRTIEFLDERMKAVGSGIVKGAFEEALKPENKKTLKEAAVGAGDAAVEGAIKAAEKPENLAKMKAAAVGAGDAFVDGALASTKKQANKEQLETVAGGLAAGAREGAAEGAGVMGRLFVGGPKARK